MLQRYEHDGKFWQIQRSGATLTITYGKIGNKGRATVKTLASAGAAQSEHDQLVLDKQRAGYRLVKRDLVAAPAAAPVGDDDRGAALEAAIAEDPYDRDAYAVYGDWLQRHGDPRGELIALQLAAEAEPAKPKQTAIGKLLANQSPILLGALARLVPDVRDPAKPPFVWRFGFIHRAEVASAPGEPVARIVDDVFRHPSGKFLVELAAVADPAEVTDLIEAIARSAPATLRELDLLLRDEVDLTELAPAFRQLHRLSIAAPAFELGRLEMPRARRVRLHARSMRASCVQAVVAAPWPELQRLELRFCGQRGSTEATMEDVRPLLRRSDLPALTHLRLRGLGFAGAVCRELVEAPLARQLQVIDLGLGSMTRNDVALLAQHKTAFPELRELWLPVRDETLRELTGIAKHVLGHQRAQKDTFESLIDPAAAARENDRYDGIRE